MGVEETVSGRKTPSRLRPANENSTSLRKKSPGRPRPATDSASDIKNDERLRTPTKTRKVLNSDSLYQPQTPEQQQRTTAVTENQELRTLKERTAPDPPATLPRPEQEPRSPDPPALTFGIKDTARFSTPARARRKVDGTAAEQIPSARRTPQRERQNSQLPAVRDARQIRERSFSPASRLRRALSRTPPRDRADKQNSVPRLKRNAISQSPPRERLSRTKSGSLSPAPRRPSSRGRSTLENISTETMPKRPISRGKRRLSSGDSKGCRKNDSDTTQGGTVLHIHQNSSGSQDSSSNTKTPNSLRRKIGAASRHSPDSDAASTRSRTPTRIRRRNRMEQLDAPKTEQLTGKVSIRPRRRGGDRDTSSGTAASENAVLRVVSPSKGETPSIRRKTPTRARPASRTLTPTKQRTKVSALPRFASERKFAPDPPGDQKTKARSQSVNRSRQSRTQARALVASASAHSNKDSHLLREFFD